MIKELDRFFLLTMGKRAVPFPKKKKLQLYKTITILSLYEHKMVGIAQFSANKCVNCKLFHFCALQYKDLTVISDTTMTHTHNFPL